MKWASALEGKAPPPSPFVSPPPGAGYSPPSAGLVDSLLAPPRGAGPYGVPPRGPLGSFPSRSRPKTRPPE